MKNAIRILSILLLLLACNDDSNTPSQNNREATVTEVGIPEGVASTKDIGPAGGSLTSDDGMLDVIVPANAVSSNTTFSIQPITNFCPGGMFAYRLLPEGLTFTDPVTLVFHYTEDDVEGTLPEFLGIAYQATDKVWYRLPSAIVDEAAKTISVEAKHFTDWAAISFLEIAPRVPAVPALRAGKTLDLFVFGIDLSDEEDELPPLPANPPGNPSPNDDELLPLPVPQPFKAEWFVNGVKNGNPNVGTITFLQAAGDLYTYRYTAAENVPAGNPVLVSVEITGLKQWVFVGGNPRVTTHNKVILFKRIKIKPDEYNYNLKIEYKDDYSCGYQGQVYYDAVEVDVHVKGNNVTVDNIVNQTATVTPLTISIVGNCTLTCNPGSTGHYNVISGTGEVVEHPFEESDILEVDLLNKNCDLGAVNTLICPDIDPIVANGEPYEHTDNWTFALTDSIQTTGSTGPFGLFVKLTPK